MDLQDNYISCFRNEYRLKSGCWQIQYNRHINQISIHYYRICQKEESYEAPAGNKDLELFHIMKIGTLVEDVESYLRSQLDSIYFGKTKDVISLLKFFNRQYSKHAILKEKSISFNKDRDWQANLNRNMDDIIEFNNEFY